MIDPILSTITALLQLGMDADSNNKQLGLGYQNLFETKRANREKEQLATSSREDALGNLIEYVPGVGWKIRNTPMTKGILDAQQAETLASLTEDAPRNRQAIERRDERSIMGDEEFEKQFNEYKYSPEKSESQYIADATDAKLRGRRKGADDTAAIVNKSLLRTGNSSNIPAVFTAARDAEANEFEDILAGGRRQGMQDYYTFENAKDNKELKNLEFLRGLSDDTVTAPVRFSGVGDKLEGDRDQALQTLLSTLASNQGSESNAMGNVTQLAGQSLNLAPLASALGKFDFDAMLGFDHMDPTSGAPIPRPREEGVRARIRAGF